MYFQNISNIENLTRENFYSIKSNGFLNTSQSVDLYLREQYKVTFKHPLLLVNYHSHSHSQWKQQKINLSQKQKSNNSPNVIFFSFHYINGEAEEQKPTCLL